jgi:hypothetical protein
MAMKDQPIYKNIFDKPIYYTPEYSRNDIDWPLASYYHFLDILRFTSGDQNEENVRTQGLNDFMKTLNEKKEYTGIAKALEIIMDLRQDHTKFYSTPSKIVAKEAMEKLQLIDSEEIPSNVSSNDSIDHEEKKFQSTISNDSLEDKLKAMDKPDLINTQLIVNSNKNINKTNRNGTLKTGSSAILLGLGSAKGISEIKNLRKIIPVGKNKK